LVSKSGKGLSGLGKIGLGTLNFSAANGGIFNVNYHKASVLPGLVFNLLKNEHI
jgi:hypothetical protein